MSELKSSWILWPLSRYREYQVYSKVFQKHTRRFQHTNVEIYSRSTSEELKCYLYKNILNYIFKYWHLIASSLVVLVTIGDIKKSHGREALLYKLCTSSRLGEVRHSGPRCKNPGSSFVNICQNERHQQFF